MHSCFLFVDSEGSVAIYPKRYGTMLYVKDTDKKQILVLYNTGMAPMGEALFEVYTTGSKERVMAQDVVLERVGTLGFYMAVTLPNGFRTGEYEYVISQAGGMVANGLLQVGSGDKIGSGRFSIKQG